MFIDPPKSKRFKKASDQKSSFLRQLTSTSSYLTFETVRGWRHNLDRSFAARRNLKNVKAAEPAGKLKKPPTAAAIPKDMFALEQRIVFDGAAVVTADQIADEVAERQSPDADTDPAPTQNDVAPAPIDLEELAANISAGSGTTEIAFIDGSLANINEILDAIDPAVEIVLLDPTSDGVEQIAAALNGRDGIDAIHILTHGNQGELFLGNAVLDAESMQGEYADELAVIGAALTSEGDLLIYGCDFTGGEDGLQAAIILGGITGADIAASTDETGHADLGGDWDLETSIGLINVDSIQAVNWEGLLAPAVITAIDGTTTTATTLANNIAGAGVTITGVNFVGANTQGGLITGATGYANEWLGFDSGIVLSTGDVADTLGPNAAGNTTTNYGGAGDADLAALAGNTSNDAAVLELNFTSTSNVLTLQFTFGSEEYNEYVYSNFNDAVGVWVNGVHSSVTPTGAPVAIDAINQAANFNPASGNQANDPNPGNGVYDSSNPSLYVDNSTGTYDVEADGFTVTLSFTATVIGDGVTNNTIKLGVSDIGDGAWDSWLFVRENSLQTHTLANTDFASTTTDTAVTIDALANDWDFEGDTLSITHIADQPITAGGAAVTLATGATVNLTVTGELLYTPATGQAGTENFTYTINDGTGSTAVGFVSVQIGPNSPPVIDLNDDGTTAARDFTANYTEGDAPLAVAANNASVTDANDISFPSLDITLGGFLSAGNEVLSFSGTDFTFGTAQTTIVNFGSVTANIIYDGANGFAITNAAPSAEISDADLEDILQSITYDHNGAATTSGARTLSFQVDDGDATSNIAVSTINVTGTNNTPTAIGNAYNVNEDDGSAVIGNALTDNTGAGVDSDPDGDTLSVIPQTSVAGSTGGLFAISATGQVTFDTNGDFEGLAVGATQVSTFTYQISDGNGGFDAAIISVTVTGVNDAPVADDEAINVDEDTAQ